MQSNREISAPPATTSCATEPIHVPGSIQPHGLLLLFDAASGNLAHWAGDFVRLLGIGPEAGCSASDLLGTPLEELIGSRPLIVSQEARYVGVMRPPQRPPLAIQAHRTGRFVAIELQPADLEPAASAGDAIAALEQVRAISDRIGAQPGLAEACAAAAEEVRSLTEFDRVMLYRFLDDGSGLVVAEARSVDATAYLNHRFPSSDIPSQARELYRRNLIRTIPDVDYCPAPVELDPDRPIDMSHCSLRSISPIHVQYLKNMDVGASMSVSLLVKGKLWGLIACHHRAARMVPVPAQLLCRHVGISLSSFILSFEQADRARLDGLQRVVVESGLRRLRSSGDPERALRKSAEELKLLVQCGGFVLLAQGELVAGAGRIPGSEELSALAPLVESQLKGRESYWTDRAAEALPIPASGAAPIGATASGVLAVCLDTQPPLLALWLRPEQVEEIDWAGDPNAKDAPVESGAPLGPRRSFATWRETVRGRSRPWMWHEVDAVELFQSRAGYTLQRHRVNQLNRQLADANEGLSALATTDPLTGLPNRRLFDERLHAEWEHALRHGNKLGLIAIDVDHFKQYNDCFGHPAGDECLRQVAGAIESTRRSIDVAARIGGEEFAILLPGAGARSTASVANRVRRAIEQLGLDHPHGEFGMVTISVGTAVGSPSESGNASDLTNAADRALYAAKQSGRNRVATSG